MTLRWERDADQPLEDWVPVDLVDSSSAEPIVDRIIRIQADLQELAAFYKVETSPARLKRFRRFISEELRALEFQAPFSTYTQDEKMDYHLLQKYLVRAKRTLDLEEERDREYAALYRPFAGPIISIINARMSVAADVQPASIAYLFDSIKGKVIECKGLVENARPGEYSKAAGYRAAKMIGKLREHLTELHEFYNGYAPLWDWWVRKPYDSLDTALADMNATLNEKIVGIESGDEDAIVGEPIGRKGLLAELEAEMIPYTPEQLIRIAEKEYKWCEAEMKKASQELGFGDEWRNALEHVKDLVEPPGSQPVFIKSLVNEGTAYVKRYDLVTVPEIAEEAIRMVMIPPKQQKVSPFFLGGPVLMVSYPTADMSHEEKMMSIRGNNRHFSKATAFHEMIPGHHLQLYVAERSKPHRQMFQTPFYIEGWALYWELVFWERGDFFTTPEDRVGTLFWRMHRCARIIFSLKFHLGQMTPAECIDLLVNWVGHERATAEGEVRRSFNGDYGPLYQAGYLLGALQLWKLRSEVLGQGLMREKEFHDRILRANMMPIEMLRALLLNQELGTEFESKWKFYGDI